MARGRRTRAGETERGASAVEYSLLVGLLALGMLGAVAAVGGELDGSFGAVTTVIGPAAAGPEEPEPSLPGDGGGGPAQPGPPGGCPPGLGGGGPRGGGPPGCR